MKYNFDEVTDRGHNKAAKYDEKMKKFGGEDVIPLWVADMDFRIAEPIIGALKERAEEEVWEYTFRPGSCFEAIRSWQKRRGGWDIKKEMMSRSLGVMPALSSVVKLFSEPGDSTMIQTPMYSEFYSVTKAWGRNVLGNRLVEKDGVWGIDSEDSEAKAKEAGVLLLYSPHNPLGTVWNREEMARMADICMASSALLVSDEIHSDLVFHEKKYIPATILSTETIGRVVNCISDAGTFNLAGLQASIIILPNLGMKKKFDDFQVAMNIHRNDAFSSVVMEVAFNKGEEWLEQLLAYLDGSLTFVRECYSVDIPKIKPTVPDATYLVWLGYHELNMDNETLRTSIVEKAGLELNEEYTLGRSLSGYMKLNAARPGNVPERALGRLKNAMDRL